jgi:multiple sugar transport system permease protein
VITLPLFPTVDFLGLSDTYLLLVVLYATFFVSLNTVIMKAFIDGIPGELDDAARVDGASELQTLFRVILPLAAQGMVAAAVWGGQKGIDDAAFPAQYVIDYVRVYP